MSLKQSNMLANSFWSLSHCRWMQRNPAICITQPKSKQCLMYLTNNTLSGLASTINLEFTQKSVSTWSWSVSNWCFQDKLCPVNRWFGSVVHCSPQEVPVKPGAVVHDDQTALGSLHAIPRHHYLCAKQQLHQYLQEKDSVF